VFCALPCQICTASSYACHVSLNCHHASFHRPKPLQIWHPQVQNGHVKRVMDPDIHSSSIEVMGSNVATNYIMCPPIANQTLGIKLPYLNLIVKNLNKYFSFEVQVLDDKNVKRRFRASTYVKKTSVAPFLTVMPMTLDKGWNQIQFNLNDFLRRSYQTNYVETLRIQVHANCRIRRVYFSDKLYGNDELPAEFQLLRVDHAMRDDPPPEDALGSSGEVPPPSTMDFQRQIEDIRAGAFDGAGTSTDDQLLDMREKHDEMVHAVVAGSVGPKSSSGHANSRPSTLPPVGALITQPGTQSQVGFLKSASGRPHSISTTKASNGLKPNTAGASTTASARPRRDTPTPTKLEEQRLSVLSGRPSSTPLN
jgi:hypothetical protein